ncbi:MULTISPECIES: L-lactate MFS transporter [Paenibacillus]|uniref:MFS transporter n=3 Tax=Paenibacillus TaxID=44249 RepID=A0AAJ3J401_PAEPO|nr:MULTISPECIES: OFA family MFS transporter [Paenibacillus]MBP1173705.1 MFS family permease [Paenibacillus sp. PvR133]MCP3745560.1 OFA family MFS transporter [Paenibacillus sp. A3M_27_13]AIW42253.1 major facilitator family transporter [Paenibacillus polymyxa CR1]ALA44514.1 major facilitator family transporter [Paenibacillus peoriae]APB73695.1 MFS transporter [Paenibacillus polymyxa]
MELTKKRWIILIASCFINLCIGSIYAWSVFSAPMAEYLSSVTGLSLTPGNLAIAFTITNSVGPITMISGGWINDRFGPKKVIFVGGLLFGGGMILSGFATSVGYLVLAYGIVLGLGTGMVYGCTISNSIKFFPDKRGLVGGITTAAYGISSVIIPPIANSLISRSGVTSAFIIIGIAFLIIVCAASFFIEKCPSDFVPAGWTPKTVNVGRSIQNDKDWKGMLSSPLFYIMILLLMCGAFAGLMCTSQASPIAQKMIGMSAAAATTVVSVLALFNTGGRIVAGYISDKIGRINTLAFSSVFSVIGLTLLYFSGEGSVLTFYIGISVIGLCFGALMGVFPGFTADQFGVRNNSVNYGIMFIGFATAGYFGPSIMSHVYSTDSSYQRAFVIAAVLGITGLVLTFVYKFTTRKNQKMAVDMNQKAIN